MYELVLRFRNMDDDACGPWLDERICTVQAMAAEAGAPERDVWRWIKSKSLETTPCQCRPGKRHHSCTRGALLLAAAFAPTLARHARLKSLGPHRIARRQISDLPPRRLLPPEPLPRTLVGLVQWLTWWDYWRRG
jgi:hypothetical protein